MNLQEALRKVKDQGRLVKGKYIDSDGCRCIIGHMLTDEQIEKVVESANNAVHVNVISYLLDIEVTPLMIAAQLINDHAECFEDLEEALKKAEKELCI